MRGKNVREETMTPRLVRSRRRLLAGAAGAVGAAGLLAGETVIAAKPAQANTGDNMVLGEINSAGSGTILNVSNFAGQALGINTDQGAAIVANGGGGVGLWAGSGSLGGWQSTRDGVHGITDSSSASGVWGENRGGGVGVTGSTSSTGTGAPPGVSGTNFGTGPGVLGTSNGGAALYGLAPGSEGLYAQSGTTAGSTPGATGSGVHAVTDGSLDSAVWGEAVGGGVGVAGTTNDSSSPAISGSNDGSGPGVLGQSRGGAAVKGSASGGVAVLAQAFGGGVGMRAEAFGGGPALQVRGRSVFQRSGRVDIAFPHQSATASVPGGLSSAALVLALMQNVLTDTFVTAAVPHISEGKITIHLNKAPGSRKFPRTAHVAWFIVN